MDPSSGEVLQNLEVSNGIYRLRLKPSGRTPACAAGQFFMVGVGRGLDPLLRRPLGWLWTSRDEAGDEALEFLYEVRGRGTAKLGQARTGETLDYIGPLGRGFRLEPPPASVIMVAGGMGVVPLYAAARTWLARGQDARIEFIHGAKSERGLVLREELAAAPISFLTCTEDGCFGEKGLVTNLLAHRLSREVGRDALILACGPRAMLREVVRQARQAGVACQVSLEARMACGMGACLTCSIRAADGKNLKVCQDGPVFAAEAIDWEALDDLP